MIGTLGAYLPFCYLNRFINSFSYIIFFGYRKSAFPCFSDTLDVIIVLLWCTVFKIFTYVDDIVGCRSEGVTDACKNGGLLNV